MNCCPAIEMLKATPETVIKIQLVFALELYETNNTSKTLFLSIFCFFNT